MCDHVCTCKEDTRSMNETSRLTSVVFRLNRDRLDTLKELSKETRIRQSEYLREAISDLIEKYEDRLID
jgi:predicted DNA-binding protein